MDEDNSGTDAPASGTPTPPTIDVPATPRRDPDDLFREVWGSGGAIRRTPRRGQDDDAVTVTARPSRATPSGTTKRIPAAGPPLDAPHDEPSAREVADGLTALEKRMATLEETLLATGASVEQAVGDLRSTIDDALGEMRAASKTWGTRPVRRAVEELVERVGELRTSIHALSQRVDTDQRVIAAMPKAIGELFRPLTQHDAPPDPQPAPPAGRPEAWEILDPPGPGETWDERAHGEES